MTIHSIFFATSRSIPMNKTDLIIHYLKRDLSPTDEHAFKAEYFTIAPIFTSLDFKVMPLVSQVWNNSIYFDWRDLRVWIGHGQVRRILFTSNCKHFLWYLPPTGDANTVGSDKNVWSSCFKRINWKNKSLPTSERCTLPAANKPGLLCNAQFLISYIHLFSTFRLNSPIF